MIEAIKNSHALRMLLLVGGGILALILAVHYFSKKQPGLGAAAADGTNGTGQQPTEVSNTTVLINGYPTNQSPPTAVPVPVISGPPTLVHGGVNPVNPPATITRPPILPPGPSGGVNRVHTPTTRSSVPPPVTATVSVGGTIPATPAPTAPSAAMLAASQAFGVPVQTLAAAAVPGASAPTTPMHPGSAETLITHPNTAHTLSAAQIASIRKSTRTNARPRVPASQSSAAQALAAGVASARARASSAMDALRRGLQLN